MAIREQLNKVLVWGDTHRKAAMGIICFVVGTIVGKFFL
jgi:hypothetical protein